MQKIVILGPESTGKTTLTRHLEVVFDSYHLEEYAREYLDGLNRPYSSKDLVQIARGQISKENKAFEKCSQVGYPYIFLDTDLTVIKIWSEYKYKACHPFILNNYRKRQYDFYLLTYPDLPWEPDPLRENPGDRMEIFDLYLNELRSRDVKYKIISGQGDTRIRLAEEAVNNLSGTGI